MTMKEEENSSEWQVYFTATAGRQKKKLPVNIVERLATLVADLEEKGPIQRSWSHFSGLGKSKNIPSNSYHCHIKSGRPTYVVCWQVINKVIQIIEIFYVGTHENAPY